MTKPMNRSQRKRLQKSWTKVSKRFPGLAGLMAGAAIALQAPVAFAAGEIQIVTQFDPETITQGDSTVVNFNILNNAPQNLTNASLNLPLPAGIRIDPTAGTGGVVTNSCNLNVSFTGNTAIVISGGTVPAFVGGIPGDCDLAIGMVGSKAPGPDIQLTTPPGAFSAGPFSNDAASVGNIRVNQIADLSSTLVFSPDEIPGGGVTTFRFQIQNPSGRLLTGANFTNGFNLNVPAGFTFRAGSLSNTCGGTITDLNNLQAPIRLVGGEIPAGGCFFEFEMDGPTVETTFGPFSWSAGDLTTDLEVSNRAATSNAGNVVTGMTISQNFNRSDVFINEATTLTINLRNAGAAVSGATLNSIITQAGGDLAELELSGTNGNIDTTCPTLPGVTLDNAGNLQFTNVSIGAAAPGPTPAAEIAECRIRVRLVGDENATTENGTATYTSAIAANQLRNDQRVANNTSFIIRDLGGVDGGVGNGINFRFGFGLATGSYDTQEVAAGNRGRLRVTMNNIAGAALTNIDVGGSGIQLEAGMRLADSDVFNNTCGGSSVITATAGGQVITVDDAAIGRRGSCSFDVNVVSDQFNLTNGYSAFVAANIVSTDEAAGQQNRTYTNTQAWNSGVNQGHYLEVTDSLNIIPSMATSTVAPNANARIQLALTNSLASARAGLRLRYRLPFGIAAVPNFAAGPTCGGIGPGDFNVVDVGGGNFELQIDGIAIPAKGATNATTIGDGQDGVCDIAFDVEAPGSPQSDVPVIVAPNTLSTVDGTVQNRTTRRTEFDVVALRLNLTQTIFNEEIEGLPETATRVRGGEPVVLTVRLQNPNSNPVDLTNIVFNDTLEDPTAIIVPGGVPTTTCAGATPVVDEATKSFGITGVNLARNASCELRVPVSTLSVSLLSNNIPPGAALAQEGASNTNNDDDQIQVTANLALIKTFTPSTINTDGVSRLNLTVLNATTQAYADLVLQDNLPSGMTLANDPNLVSTCGAASAPSGGNVVNLTNGNVNVNDTCVISVDVTSLTASGTGGYENRIPAGAVNALGGAIGTIRDATATLFVNGVSIERPTLRLVKRITEVQTPARPGFAEAIVPITSVNDFVPASGPDTDSAPGWPAATGGNAISDYLVGAYNTAQIPGGQSETLTSGMEIEYTGYYLSNGTGSAENTELCDAIPANTTFVPGSLQWVRGDGITTPIDDATGFAATPPASCDGADNGKGAVVVDLGSVPNSTGPGAPANSYGKIVFRVTVD